MVARQHFSSAVDVLIVGSGPVGSTYARLLSEAVPKVRILMVDLGPQLTARPGLNAKNISDHEEQISAQVRSQGPANYPYVPLIEGKADAGPMSGPGSLSTLARPGTHLVSSEAPGLDDVEMPGAAMSSNVGGMGVHWTGACPRPSDTERPPFIPNTELDAALACAEQLLNVTQNAYPESAESRTIIRKLGEIFDSRLAEGRKVQPMPLACRVMPNGTRHWSGADTVLGPLAEPEGHNNGRFELRPDTVCRQLFTDGDHVTGALLQHRVSGREEAVAARAVVVAADPLRTPQLLWGSGIRPSALGHYLNEHPVVMSGVALAPDFGADADAHSATRTLPMRSSPHDPYIGSFWVPFSSPGHPYHGQVMYLDVSPAGHSNGGSHELKHVVGMGWSGPKESRYQDCVTFSESELDFFGMPVMTIHFGLTEQDRAVRACAAGELARATAAFGTPSEPRYVLAGGALHYLGTVRMGEQDDGQSVCDSYSLVWGFQNLFVGGNGVIPTALACNPTLTSVALAVRSCEHIASLFSS